MEVKTGLVYSQGYKPAVKSLSSVCAQLLAKEAWANAGWCCSWAHVLCLLSGLCCRRTTQISYISTESCLLLFQSGFGGAVSATETAGCSSRLQPVSAVKSLG